MPISLREQGNTEMRTQATLSLVNLAKAPTTRAGSHPMMNAVGGTTLHYWAQSWRLNPWDFKVVSETTKKYGASRTILYQYVGVVQPRKA